MASSAASPSHVPPCPYWVQFPTLNTTPCQGSSGVSPFDSLYCSFTPFCLCYCWLIKHSWLVWKGVLVQCLSSAWSLRISTVPGKSLYLSQGCYGCNTKSTWYSCYSGNVPGLHILLWVELLTLFTSGLPFLLCSPFIFVENLEKFGLKIFWV